MTEKLRYGHSSDAEQLQTIRRGETTYGSRLVGVKGVSDPIERQHHLLFRHFLPQFDLNALPSFPSLGQFNGSQHFRSLPRINVPLTLITRM